ncbi:GNAT family N-acetyltransferase [Clostridium intestinale]|uniref:GNAT family N-acetyltransferase n=1 Tax=Clostridium intestinale TaxID=36845 RepID=A0A7D6ZSN6_9CLOT|nr:GNAT family protein [Clostridium intestinale]QLY81623.1 GNAT family N-acetyltransferase [Clostridium intestinale]
MLNMRNFLELNGNIVYLKKLDKEYIEEYWNNFKNTSIETMIFTGSAQAFNKTEIENYIDRVAGNSDRVDFLIFSKQDNKLVGEVVINEVDRNNRCGNIRILINRKEDFSKGYGTEAMILALNYGFGMFNLHRIELEAYPFNNRAVHVYEKIGFKREGIRRDGAYYNHKYYDMITMSFLEHEFRERYLKTLDLEDFI